MDDLFKLIRCPTYSGQSITELNIEITTHIKQYLIERVYQGQSGNEIKDQFVRVFGNQIFLDPKLQSLVEILWLIPFTTLLTLAIFFFFKKKRQ